MTPNPYGAYAATAIPAPVRRKQARIDAKTGGVLVATGLEKKMQERQRLSRAYKKSKRDERRRVFEAELRLAGFLTYLRSVTADRGDELIEAIAACDWLRTADYRTRIFALEMIQARCDRINRKFGIAPLDDPLPPETSVYLRARALLHAGGRA